MAAENLDIPAKRPCCLLLRELTESLSSLENPQKTEEVLETISQHCLLVKLVGKSKAKIDFSKGQCYLTVHPDEAQSVITEAQKTAEVFNELAHFEELFNKISEILANNANLKDINGKMQLYLAEMREGERRFGAVPFTEMQKEQVSQGLSAGEQLQSHPLMENSTQMDGMPPESNMDASQDPEAAQKAQELQLELHPELRHQLGMGAAPTFKRER